MKKFNPFQLSAFLILLGSVICSLTANAQVALRLTSNAPSSTAVISVVTGANGFKDPNNIIAGNVAGTFIVIRVASTQPNLTLNGFIGYNGYTNAGTVLPTGAKLITPFYTYFLIDNSDAVTVGVPNTVFPANSVKPIIGFNVTGGTGNATIEIAPLNDPIALLITTGIYGPDALNYSTSDIATPNRTVSSLSGSTITGTPLPINLLTFAATKAGTSRSLISWATVSEEAANYFEVERSVTGDASTFRSIGVRTPATNGKSEVSYQAYDETPATGANYYRLKMVDISGAVTYSDTRIVRFDNRGATESVSLFPNPIQIEGQDVKLKVNVLTAQTLEYTLVDVTGKLIYNSKLDVTAGTANYSVQGFNNIAPGSYFLRVKGETLNDNIKVLKTN